MKNLTLKSLAGFAVFFAVGWLVYGFVLVDYMASNVSVGYAGVERAPEDFKMGYMAVGNLALGILIAYVGQLRGDRDWLAGFKGGAIVAFLYACTANLMSYSMLDLTTITATWLDIVVMSVLGGLMGTASALVGNSSEA